MALTIYVMDRGWAIVGDGRPDPANPLFVRLSRCATIRRWGTASGLGQLAMSGPLENTKLDAEPDGVRVNLLFVAREIPCDEEAWKAWKPTG